jgi:hypothetical protein
MQHSTSDQTRTPLGDVPNTNVDNMGGVNHPTALMDTAALRARLLVIKESVKEGMQGMPPELQESAMRACELEVLPDFALGDDTYAAAPGVVRGFLSQYTSVPLPGELVMPSDNAKPEEVDAYLLEVVTFLRAKFEERGISGDNFNKLFAGGRGGFSLVANAHIYTHQVQAWFVLADLLPTVEVLRSLDIFNLHFADGPLAFDPTVPVHGFLTDEKMGRTVVPHASLIRIFRKQTGKDLHVRFNKKRYPGKLFVAGVFTEQEIGVIGKNGGCAIGNKMAPLVALDPNADKIKMFIEASAINSVKAFNSVLAPQLAGKLRVDLTAMRVTTAANTVVMSDFTIFRVEVPHTDEIHDRYLSLVAMRAFRCVHKSQFGANAFAVRLTGSLPEMQALMRVRLLRPPAIEDDSKEEDEPLQLDAPAGASVLTPLMLQGAQAANSAPGPAPPQPAPAAQPTPSSMPPPPSQPMPEAVPFGVHATAPEAAAQVPTVAEWANAAAATISSTSPPPRTPAAQVGATAGVAPSPPFAAHATPLTGLQAAQARQALPYAHLNDPRTDAPFDSEYSYMELILTTSPEDRQPFEHLWANFAQQRAERRFQMLWPGWTIPRLATRITPFMAFHAAADGMALELEPLIAFNGA